MTTIRIDPATASALARHAKRIAFRDPSEEARMRRSAKPPKSRRDPPGDRATRTVRSGDPPQLRHSPPQPIASATLVRCAIRGYRQRHLQRDHALPVCIFRRRWFQPASHQSFTSAAPGRLQGTPQALEADVQHAVRQRVSASCRRCAMSSPAGRGARGTSDGVRRGRCPSAARQIRHRCSRIAPARPAMTDQDG
jgi:hypothetical protein